MSRAPFAALGPLTVLDLRTLADALALAEDADEDERHRLDETDGAAADDIRRIYLNARLVRTRAIQARVAATIARLEGRPTDEETDR
jgi:hypothetical protein